MMKQDTASLYFQFLFEKKPKRENFSSLGQQYSISKIKHFGSFRRLFAETFLKLINKLLGLEKFHNFTEIYYTPEPNLDKD